VSKTADNVVVAGTGTVWVAPAETALPTDLEPLTDPFVDLGYTTEEGVKFSLKRTQKEISAWQAAEAIRILVTAEPKTIAIELLQFDPQALMLALRGGAFELDSGGPSVGDEVVTYTPPETGASDERVLVIDAVDGEYLFRFAFARVNMQGDVTWEIVKTAATSLPLEFGVLAATPPYQILSNHPAWIEAATPETLPAAVVSSRKRKR